MSKGALGLFATIKIDIFVSSKPKRQASCEKKRILVVSGESIYFSFGVVSESRLDLQDSSDCRMICKFNARVKLK